MALTEQNGADDQTTLRQLTALFVVFAGVALLAGASRVAPPAWQLVSLGGDVMRIREALSMFVFAPSFGVIFWLMCRCVGRRHPSALLDVLMVLAIYFVACGMGMHDPTNRMVDAYRKADTMTAPVRQSLLFFDDAAGHWVFWAGFVLWTWVLGVRQALAPLREPMGRVWRFGFGGVSILLFGVMVTNLWDEYPKTRVDLCVILAAVLVPLGVHFVRSRGVSLWRLPVLVVIYPAYLGSVAGTLACWLIRYGKV